MANPGRRAVGAELLLQKQFLKTDLLNIYCLAMRHALLFVAVGLMLSYIALELGGWGHFLHWFAFSCLALSAGHAGLGHRVFGKQSDGRIPVWIKAIHLPYLLLSGLAWRVLCLLSRESATAAVSDVLIVGRRLRGGELPQGVANYVDLTAEMEDPVEIRRTASYICLPILDAGVPTSGALQSAIERLGPGLTFVHCAQGHGRTGLFALALLAESGLITSFEQGMALLKAARPGIALNKRQEQFARDYLAARKDFVRRKQST